ncbi:acyl-CoA dehydrogenase family protein [Pimelobacter simplex]|uniref:acyl-CoA dehydrogenase family protein n=1 Tax=Nocardioides simplex TaxID=2045 RepID=UPI00193148C2|nr:acyl-CoA dehydrogenase [Pimelobacter simplex]
MTFPYTFEQRAMSDVVRAWAKDVDTIAIVRTMEDDPNAWRRHWRSFADLGLLATAEGGTAQLADMDLAVVLAIAGETLVPGPLLSTVAAIVAIETTIASGGDPLGDLASIREALVVGAITAGIATDIQHGSGIALGADEQGVLLAAENGRSYLIQPDGFNVSPADALDFSQPTGTVRIHPAAARLSISLSQDELRTVVEVLVTAALSGVARWGAQTMATYAGIREQFGQPIGKFQAVKHLCAEAHCGAERLTALAWGGMQAVAESTSDAAIVGAAGAAVGLDDAVRVCQSTIQVLGGIGYSFEHDAHLYFRRALALRQYVGAERAATRAARLALRGERPRLTHPNHGHTLDESTRSKVADVANLAPAERQRALADHGLVMPDLAPPHGLGADLPKQLAIEEALRATGVERAELNITNWVVPTLLEHGSQELIDLLVTPSLRGDLLWCQLFSEPGAGSDLAGLRTKARRVDGGWEISGQKVWNSFARDADWGLLLARTDADQTRHAGLTMFVLDMSAPGIRCRPLREITGESLFNEVFLDGVFIPDAHAVGKVDDGWAVARTTLASERVAMGGAGAFGAEEEHLLELVASSDSPPHEVRVGRHVAEAVAVSLLGKLRIARVLAGNATGVEAMVTKVLGVRHRQALAESTLSALGQAGAIATDEGSHVLMVRCLSIAGGSEQVLLSAIAERGMGVPR